jgi:hypothetical protein
MPSKPRPGKSGLPAKQGELTSKQTGFALDVGVKELSLTDAYRANCCADNMAINSIYVEACNLAANPKVKQRIRELQKHKLKALSITGDSRHARAARAFEAQRKRYGSLQGGCQTR